MNSFSPSTHKKIVQECENTGVVESPEIPLAKTPRRIQWLDEDSTGRPLVSRSTHVLDEQGLDPEAFRHLTKALERHRASQQKPWSKVHYYTSRIGGECQSSSSGSIDEEDETDENSSSEDEDAITTIPIPRKASSSPSRTKDKAKSIVPSPMHEVPDNYIDPYEEVGLPGTKDLSKYSNRKAARVVQTHLHKRGSKLTKWRAMRNGKSSVTKLPVVAAPPICDDDEEKDLEGGDVEAEVAPTSGILSSLLQLYGRGPALDLDSVTTLSTLLSPTSTRVSSPELDEEFDEDEKIPATRRKCQQLKSKLHLSASRPIQSRNAGGVIGSLIASTGNLVGVAAPVHGQLQPNVKRSGYCLSRYSVKPPTRPPPAMVDGYDPETGACFEIQEKYSSASPFYKGMRNLSATVLDNIPHGRRSGTSTPHATPEPTSDHEDWLRRYHHGPNKKNKRRKAEVFITKHVARIIQREEFILKLTRAMMMFGGPSHRLQSQIQCAAKVLDIDLCVVYFPDIVLISFDDGSTGTSHVRVIKQASALDLEKLDDAYHLYWKVIHDKMFVTDASAQLDILMRKKPFYNWWQQSLIGAMCSTAICTVSFGGSFIDALMVYPLGALLVAIQQLSVRNVLYANVFEFTITALFSFLAAALAATHHFCYSAIASSSVVLILPGFLVLTGSLEIMSRKIVSGSVRLSFALMYALFLGFGFAIGASCFERFTGTAVHGAEDYSCTLTHNPDGPWYQRTPSKYWAFLTVPLFSACLSMKNQAPYNRRELPLLVIIASIGWVTNYFTGTKFVGQSDITAAVGAFAVGVVANLYARMFSGCNAFVVMITGILFQLPSGLGSGGLLSYASQQASGSTTSYISGFHTAMKLVSVAIGLTVGLGMANILVHPRQSKKREDGIFTM